MLFLILLLNICAIGHVVFTEDEWTLRQRQKQRIE